jgi:hypothetical protein
MASPEDALDLLDATGASPVVVWQGTRHALPDPASMTWREVVDSLEQPHLLVGHMPALHGLTVWQRAEVQRAWVRVYDLGNPQGARRLAFLVGKHFAAIEADFARWYPDRDAGLLWRQRRWRLLLSLIDHLPPNTHYHAALSMDEDHAKMVIEAEEAARKRGEMPDKKSPSVATWSPEVGVLTSILDALRENTYVTKAVATDKGGGRPPKPAPRPTSVTESVRFKMKQKAHDILKRRMLPHLYSEDDG